MAWQGSEALQRIFAELRAKSEDIRLRAAAELLGHVVSAAKGMLIYVVGSRKHGREDGLKPRLSASCAV